MVVPTFLIPALLSRCPMRMNKEQKFRSKRSAVLVGGIVPVSTTDPDVADLVEYTLTNLDQQSTLDQKYKVTEIVSATKQVVAGSLYNIEARIVPSDCPKTDSRARSECGILKEEDPQLCQIKIWDRPWLPNGRQTSVTCDQATYKFRSKRSVGRVYYEDDFSVQFNAFRDFKEKYNKIYPTTSEELRRFKIFRNNLKKIHLLNINERGTAVYGITKFSDLTYAEFRAKHMGLRTDLALENEITFPQAEIPDIELPDEFDWREKGAVTEVKNQQSCGSCWAFSVTGNVEGQYAIKHQKLLEFSEQELVDCDKYDEGCGGGLMDNAYRAIEEIGGLELESDYPYDAENEKCHYDKNLFKVELSGAVNISQNEDDMAKWLVQNGPISIAINANAMQFYVGGVSHPWKFLCNPKSLDHGVLIVGYGVHSYPTFKKTLPYWIVKNSWGKSWGEQGYYLVYRGDGTCGLNQTPSSAIVA
ncbi:Peptidase [Oryctes borbonicus]|uniref:Peptidase n=1 Tax=Oryctes borbonicus TaxID=1629725 RepID=A0A0T6B2Q4_9SCAR|nr:Peptidase [Oryctes borbonicus]